MSGKFTASDVAKCSVCSWMRSGPNAAKHGQRHATRHGHPVELVRKSTTIVGPGGK